MVDTKISGLVEKTAPTGTEEVPLNDTGIDKKMTIANLVNYLLGVINTWTAAQSFTAKNIISGTASKVTIDITSQNQIVAQQSSTDVNGCRIIFQKSRGTVGSETAITTGDVIGNFPMQGHDGSAFATGAAMKAKAEEAWTTLAHGGQLQFFTTPIGSIFSGNQNMTITANGNIILGLQTALITTAVDGFDYMPTCAGTPTGVPTVYTGKVPRVYDTTNNTLYAYNAGWIPMVDVKANGRATAQTAANASVAAYTVGANDTSFMVSANVLVTASATHNFTVTVAYTDEGNTARTITLNFSQTTGTFLTAITNVTGLGSYEGIPLHIRCKASTTITFATVGTFTSITYNVEGRVLQI